MTLSQKITSFIEKNPGVLGTDVGIAIAQQCRTTKAAVAATLKHLTDKGHLIRKEVESGNGGRNTFEYNVKPRPTLKPVTTVKAEEPAKEISSTAELEERIEFLSDYIRENTIIRVDIPMWNGDVREWTLDYDDALRLRDELNRKLII